MVKRIAPCLFYILCFSVVFADYSDGFITAGEYEWAVEWNSGLLVVNGGGAYEIWARYSSQLKVLSTSTPLGDGVGGIMDIVMDRYSTLNYYGGLTQELLMYKSATANLYGGRIDYLSSMQYATTQHVNIYCQPGWSWILDSTQNKIGITGLWLDNSSFSIRFTNNGEAYGYDPVWEDVKVITPEPAAMLLLGLGGLLIRRKK